MKEYNIFLSGLAFLGTSHKTTPLCVRERFSLDEHKIKELSLELMRNDCHSVILNTCNRIEIYISSESSPLKSRELVISKLSELSGTAEELIREHFDFNYSLGAIEHLFNVSAGLESLVLGEGQILSQVKQAYLKSCKNKTCDSVLNCAFQRALKAGKRARTETRIARGEISIPAVALAFSKEILGKNSLAGLKIMILGSGEMSKVCLNLIKSESLESLTLVKRNSSEFSFDLSEIKAPLRITDYENYEKALNEQDILLVCTSAPEYLIKPEKFNLTDKSDRKENLVICDLSVPRNVCPSVQNLEEIKLIDMDRLGELVYKNTNRREGEFSSVKKIIDEELKDFIRWAGVKQINALSVRIS